MRYNKTLHHRSVSKGIEDGPRSKNVKLSCITHNHPERNEIELKISENKTKDCSITIYNEGITELLDFIILHYNLVKTGFIDTEVSQIDEATVNSIVNNAGLMGPIIDHCLSNDDLIDAVRLKRRKQDLVNFESLIENDSVESEYQEWIEKHAWILGFPTAIIGDRRIDLFTQADYLVSSIDGYVDIVEIKRPGMRMFQYDGNHDSYYPSSDLSRAISQCIKYVNRLEIQQNDCDANARLGPILKPRCTLIAGLSSGLKPKERRYLRLLNASLSGIYIVTYDTLLDNARKRLEFNQKQ